MVQRHDLFASKWQAPFDIDSLLQFNSLEISTLVSNVA